MSFPKPDETVMDIANELRTAHVDRDRVLYEMLEGEIVENNTKVVIHCYQQTLNTLGNRLEAACKRRKDEAARLWKALEEFAEWHSKLTNRGGGLLEMLLAKYELKREGAAK